MGLIESVAPTIYTARGREHIKMSYDLWRKVEACDQALRGAGMQMKIICEHCTAHGHPHPYVAGDNQRNGASFTMTCAHAERTLDFGV